MVMTCLGSAPPAWLIRQQLHLHQGAALNPSFQVTVAANFLVDSGNDVPPLLPVPD